MPPKIDSVASAPIGVESSAIALESLASVPTKVEPSRAPEDSVLEYPSETIIPKASFGWPRMASFHPDIFGPD